MARHSKLKTCHIYGIHQNILKICEINQFSNIRGGVETYMLTSGECLSKAGHEIFYIFTDSPTPFSAGTKQYFLPGIAGHSLNEALSKTKNEQQQRDLKRFKKIVAEENPDIIHVNNFAFPLFLKNLNIPVVRTAHDYRFICPQVIKLLPYNQGICSRAMSFRCFTSGCLSFNLDNLAKFTLLQLEREFYRDIAGVIVKSKFMKQELLRNNFSAAGTFRLPLSVKLPRRISSLPNGKILYAGRLAPEKGLDILFRALRYVKAEFDLTIAGDGPELAKLKEMSLLPWLKGKVTFPGWKSPEELSNIYCDSRLLVLPSIWPEPAGLVGLEAMSYGLPVISFNAGGISEWLQHEETGYLAEPGDEKSLANFIQRLLTNKPLVQRMGKRGRELIREEYNPEKNASRMITLFQRIITTRNE